MRKTFYIIAILLFVGAGAMAQGMFGVSYDIGISLGETANFVSPTSFRGIGIEGRGFINDNLTYGGSFNWAVFYEEVGPQEWELDALEEGSGEGTAYGKQFRYINSFPIMATMHYYTGQWDETRFYFGAGVGAQKIDQRTDIGLYTINDNTWRLGFAPEIGVLIPVNFNSALNISAKYQYALKSGDSDAVSYLSFKIGFAFM
ncbi:MAG: hypothetical protein HC819_10055 [Cyclobacteriaceae bacterium]|nr:hypothetical protein [Cyclobacteriaceae bacterium]